MDDNVMWDAFHFISDIFAVSVISGGKRLDEKPNLL